MIQFVDLDTGHLYDGVAPYVHWFPGEQSTNLVYTHKICVCSDEQQISISMNSDTFNIVDIDMIDIYGEYATPTEVELKLPNILCSEYTSRGTRISVNAEVKTDQGTEVKSVNKYMHIIYFSGSSNIATECRTDVTIKEGDKVYNVIIGADFYEENESLYINLANFGVELPDSIQKTIYDVNVRESYKDNIILNRKIKELVSNYWDVIANKGSYKSLLNSLEWFEWGDLIRIREIWKHEDFGRTVYDDRSLCSVLEDKFKDTLNNFSKTTHISLYVTMQELRKELCGCTAYNPETLVPEIDNIIIKKWSKNDLMLKMCLLANFYETYFMPIHLNLFHATIEDIVFAPALGLYNYAANNRYDNISNVFGFKCNVKSGDTFTLSNVSCQVGPNTFFGSDLDKENTENIDHIDIYGVEDSIYNIKSENDLKTFYGQLFTGVGAIVPFECEFELGDDDYVTESTLIYNNVVRKHTDIIYPSGGPGSKLFNIKFKLLFQSRGEYNISIQFKTAASKLYTKSIKINIIDIANMDIKVYRVKPYILLSDDYINMFDHKNPTTHMFRRTKCNEKECTNPSDLPFGDCCSKYIIQHVPTSSVQYNSGICLNNVLILHGNHKNDYILNSYYHILFKQVDELTCYTICISKQFWLDPKIQIANFEKKYNRYIYRNDYGFFPEFHYIEELNYDNLDNCTMEDTETFVVIPELPYGLKINDWTWEFKNVSYDTSIQLPDVYGPFINDTKFDKLKKGYYDITFKCSVASHDGGEIVHTITRESAFKKK